MSFSSLQRLSVRLFSSVRRAFASARTWLEARPALARWFLPSSEDSAEAAYRDYNGQMFASFHEQERMLADRRRMAFYHAAISRHIQPGDRVIDLGTGTGILAALASRRGAEVYAIDHSEILTHARTLAAANRIRNVKFSATHSADFTLDRPVDVILHEQMGDCLFDEDMVVNVSDLRDRLLRPGGLILPSGFELYCEPIKVRDERVVPFIWDLNVCGYDYSCLERKRPDDAGYYRAASSDPTLIEHFLGEPEPVLSIDLHTVREADLPREITFVRRVVRPGRMDGYAVYFRALVDGDLTLSTSPLDPQRAPHWGFRILRVAGERFVAGEEIETRLRVGRWPDLDTWSWSHVRRAVSHPAGSARRS